MEYVAPVEDSAQASARVAEGDWEMFHATFLRRGRARLSITSEVIYGDAVAARLHGEFVAIANA